MNSVNFIKNYKKVVGARILIPGLLFYIGLFFISPSSLNAQLEWEKFNGYVPENAVKGGSEKFRNLHIGRAMYNGSYHPGKVFSRKCNIGYGGKEVELSNFEILVDNGNVSYEWVKVANNVVPDDALLAGTENGDKLYVGRAYRSEDQTWHPGKVHRSGFYLICNYGYGGKEITEKSNYEVLVVSKKKRRMMMGQQTQKTAFKHKTSSTNISGHITTIDNPLTNGNPNLILLISQEYGKYNTSQVGVWYSGGKWKIYNEDKTPIPQNTSFNVVALPPSSNAFNHTANYNNIESNWTTINHPDCNNNPNAVIMVTQNWKSTYNTGAIGVWYNGSKWAIFNQDESDMPQGVSFNVVVLNNGDVSRSVAGGSTSVLTANYNTKTSSTKHIARTSRPYNGYLFVTQNWQSRGVYNDHTIGVWNSSGKWSVFNQDKAELPENCKFNLLYINE